MERLVVVVVVPLVKCQKQQKESNRKTMPKNRLLNCKIIAQVDDERARPLPLPLANLVFCMLRHVCGKHQSVGGRALVSKCGRGSATK